MTADWYLIRATGVVSLVLLTIVLAVGIATTQRRRLAGRPRFVTAAVHRSLSLLSVVFLALHVVTSLVDPYAGVSLLAGVLPFAPAAHTGWVSVGAISLDLVVALIVTSLLRDRIGYRIWRVTHWTAYLSWPLAFAHSIGMGTDAPALWFKVVGLTCLATVVLATASRLLVEQSEKRLELQVSA